MGRRHEQTFFQRRHTDGRQAHKNMLKIALHQGNADQNSQLSKFTAIKIHSYHPKDNKQ